MGYQIRLEAKRSEDTRVLFCTTGVLLRRLAGDTLTYADVCWYYYICVLIRRALATAGK
jgi:hypothetical protein